MNKKAFVNQNLCVACGCCLTACRINAISIPCMDNVYVRTDPAGNIKPDKEKSTEKIDGVVALVMALDRAQRNLNGGSVYDERGLLTLDW